VKSKEASVNARRGPGLSKAKAPDLFEVGGRRVRMVEGRLRDLFREADAISEGAVRAEPQGRVWYGSTSLILPLPNDLVGADRAFVLAAVERDVHVRVHAIRAAHREAQSRAPGMLGRTVCEVRFSEEVGGLRIDVDVQAPLIERRRSERTGG
jgi:hypothetical protein